jgi:excisionase family DNA binding protein
MNRGNQLTSVASDAQHREPESQQGLADKPGTPKLLLCFWLLPEDAKPILGLLQNLTDSSGGLTHRNLPPQQADSVDPGSQDSWLAHSEAARYLGISTSTLYRYASQQRVECRKMGGRLEYRRSTLDQFKEKQIRPAKLSNARSIIAPALGSGK